MAKKLEELPVHSKAVEFWVAVNALLQRPAFRRDRKLLDQISDANDSIPSNMSEGFEQASDDGFARFLVYSKGSVAEVVSRLRKAQGKKLITEAELASVEAAGEELGKMLGGFIKYLRRSGFKDRGSYRSKHPEQPSNESQSNQDKTKTDPRPPTSD